MGIKERLEELKAEIEADILSVLKQELQHQERLNSLYEKYRDSKKALEELNKILEELK